MAGFTLFPAETGVKLTLQRRAAMIAPMRSRVSHMAICAAVALACNEGLQPTTAAPAIRGTVTYQGHLPDSLRDSTGAVLVVARSEEHTSELQSQSNLVCRLLLENKKTCQ